MSLGAFSVFLVDPMVTIYVPQNSAKHRFLGKFGSYNTIHTFKNYFATVFSTISFQFSTNKQYPNTSVYDLYVFLKCFFSSGLIVPFIVTKLIPNGKGLGQNASGHGFEFSH